MGSKSNFIRFILIPFASLKTLLPAVLVLGVILINFLLYSNEKREGFTRVKHEAELILSEKVNFLQSVLEYSYRYKLKDLAQSAMGALSAHPYIKEGFLVDEEGGVLAASKYSLLGQNSFKALSMFDENSLKIIKEKMIPVQNELRIQMFELESSKLLVSISPVQLPNVKSKTRNVGYLIINYDLSYHYQRANEQIFKSFLSYSLIVIVFAVLLGLFFHLWISRRALKIVSAIKKFSSGQADARVHLAGHDELKIVAEGLNQLIENISLSNERLRIKAAELEETNKVLTFAKIAAENANRSKSEFIANISHEIRTPMNAVLGITDVLEETSLSHEQHNYIKTIQKAGKNLLCIINDVLDISKVEAGKMNLELEPCSLSELIEDALQLVSARASEKKIVLRYFKSSDVNDYVMADASRIKQVMLNLLSNAIKFTDVGVVTVELMENALDKKGNILFKISDTGIGIPTTALNKIFKPFAQADSSITRRHGGTGLGLTISQSLIQLMGGEIWVKSTEGVGSSFYFTLNLNSAEVSPTEKKDLEFIPSILTYGDQEFFKYLKDDLSQMRVPIRHVDSIDQLRGQERKIIFIYFPKGISEQIQLLQQIDFKNNIYVAVSPFYDSIDKTMALEAGFNDYIMCINDQRKLINSIDKFTQLLIEQFKLDRQISKTGSLGIKKILVVDDTEENRVLIKAYLKSEPFQIFECENGQQAFLEIQSNQYDLVIMDVQMPVMDGYTSLKNIRSWENSQQRSATPVVILTAHAMNEEEVRAFACGCNAFLTKPVKKTILVETIYKNLLDVF